MKNRSKEMLAPIIVTALTVLYYVAYFGLLLSFIGGIWVWVFGIFPIVLSVLIIVVCIERIKEIKKGEEDDLSKY